MNGPTTDEPLQSSPLFSSSSHNHLPDPSPTIVLEVLASASNRSVRSQTSISPPDGSPFPQQEPLEPPSRALLTPPPPPTQSSSSNTSSPKSSHGGSTSHRAKQDVDADWDKIQYQRTNGPLGASSNPVTASGITPSQVPTPTVPTRGIILNFKRPPDTRIDRPDSRASSPGSTNPSSSTKKKRRIEVPRNPTRASRARANSPAIIPPSTTTPAGPSAEATPIPSGALSIFAPPPDSNLPEALQDFLGPSSSSRSNPIVLRSGNTPAPNTHRDKDGDALMREAGEGFESRLRSARGKDVTVRTGVSASGKGVIVGATTKEGGKVVKKKGKGKPDLDVPNQDFCSACRGVGRFLCCDGCPRSFHFMCLEPPLRVDELPDEETWYCKKCRADRNRDTPPNGSPMKERDLKPIPMVFKSLVKRVDEENPSAFRLPQEIRSFFSGVATDGKGNYVDAEETRTKYDRKGFQEERDGTRLRDGKARLVACYVCGGSPIPLRSLTTDPESSWRQIVSCDYCALHWHLDCLSPPLASMPNSGRKWMCPNHAEQVMVRRRTVRNNLEMVDIDRRGQHNNGNITVIPDEELRQRIVFEDMTINKRKYRVPEKVIRLDFWDKLGLGKGRKVPPARGGDGMFKTGSSSSLTSLDEDMSDIEEPSEEDLNAARLVLGLLHGSNGDSTVTQDATPDSISTLNVPVSTGPTVPTAPNEMTISDGVGQGVGVANGMNGSNRSTGSSGSTGSTGSGSNGIRKDGMVPKIMLRVSRPA